MSTKKFDSVWDAIEDDPVKREIYKLRSELIHVITEHIKANNLKQREVAELLGISQPRVSTLMKGDFESFRLDTLVGFALKCGRSVSINAAQKMATPAGLNQSAPGSARGFLKEPAD